jgi:hypothetical protein
MPMYRWLPAATSAVLLAAAGAVAVASGGAAGTVPAPVVQACVNHGGTGREARELYDVTTAAPAPSCSPGDTAVSWQALPPAGPSPSPDPSPSPSGTGQACTTTAAKGTCGPYDSYPGITGYNTGRTNVSNNVWNPVTGWQQALTATSPGDWSVTANMPAGNTAVVSYPSSEVNFGQAGTTLSYPLSNFTSLASTFSESMPGQADTSAEAAYDVWGGPSGQPGADWSDEVMIQHDYSPGGPPRCDSSQTAATATFAGQQWGLCVFGTELIWYLTVNEQSGTVDILAMLNWLIANGYLPADYGLEAIGYGFEIRSTGARDETFQVTGYTLTATTG